MPKKRKKNLQPHQKQHQSRPSVLPVPTEQNRCESSTSAASKMPTPATTPPPPPQPQKQLPTLFTTAEQDELLEMSESEIEQVVPARMNEILDKDGHDEKMKRQLAEAEAKHNEMRSRLEADNGKPLSEAARPLRGRPRLDKPVRPRRGRPTNL